MPVGFYTVLPVSFEVELQLSKSVEVIPPISILVVVEKTNCHVATDCVIVLCII